MGSYVMIAEYPSGSNEWALFKFLHQLKKPHVTVSLLTGASSPSWSGWLDIQIPALLAYGTCPP